MDFLTFPTPLSLSDPGIPETERVQRQAVVDEARSWVRTPYHWEADTKGVGVDCAMLLVRCWVDTRTLPPFDPRPYPSDWHLHEREERYLGWVLKFGTVVEKGRVGDILVFKIGKCFSHGGIIISQSRLVHAHRKDRVCVLGNFNDPLFRNCTYQVVNPWCPPVAKEA